MFDNTIGGWATSSEKLPQQMYHLRATSINNRVLIFGIHVLFIIYLPDQRNIIITGGEGGYDVIHVYDDILEYIPKENSIVTVGKMTKPRAHHAVSVVQAEDYLMWCN